MRPLRRTVVMSGYPASGKSTLAAALAERLDFALISKDQILGAIYDAMGGTAGDPAFSIRTGKGAWAAFWMLSRRCPQAVLDTNIKPEDPFAQARLAEIDGIVVEVLCQCPLEIAQARYAERARTPWPAQRDVTLEDTHAALYGRPLGLERRVVVDTSGPVDLDAAAAQVRGQFDAAMVEAQGACAPPGSWI
jgi:predicted kinase